MSHRVVTLVYDGLCTFEFAIVVEMFGLARPELPVEWYRFTVCSLERAPVRATGGVRVAASAGLGAFRGADTIVIPGWRNPDEAPPPALLKALRRAHARGARLMSICSAVFVLAAAGLLDGKRATTHWLYAKSPPARYSRIPVAPTCLSVHQGSILTSRASS